jgi:predicted transcriptional regulator
MGGQHTQETWDEERANAFEQLQFLTRGESRVRIMECLSASGSVTQRELRAQLAVSRTTVARSLRSLEDRGWVRNSDNGAYRLTRAGTVIVSELSGLLETVQTVEELSEFLRWFPSDEFAPDFLNPSDVEVIVSSEGDPYAPAREQTDILRSADRLRIILPAVDLEGTKTLAEQVTDRGLEVETIVSPDVEATIESGEFASLLAEPLATERARILAVDQEPPFYLGLADDGRVQIGVEDDEGFPRALLETSDGDIREWATDFYRTYRERATHKPVAEFE